MKRGFEKSIARKAQCPRSIGDEAMSVDERTFAYCRPAVMNDHFDREHLVTMEQKERERFIGCIHPKCREADVRLHTLDHFRNHVATVHGVVAMESLASGRGQGGMQV